MTQRSEFFAAARSGRWNESELSNATDLRNEDPQVFLNYLHTVDSGRVYIEVLELSDDGAFFEKDTVIDALLWYHEGNVEGVRAAKVIERYKGLMKVYLLANMLIDHKTANMVVDETFRNLRLIKTSPGRCTDKPFPPSCNACTNRSAGYPLQLSTKTNMKSQSKSQSQNERSRIETNSQTKLDDPNFETRPKPKPTPRRKSNSNSKSNSNVQLESKKCRHDLGALAAYRSACNIT